MILGQRLSVLIVNQTYRNPPIVAAPVWYKSNGAKIDQWAIPNNIPLNNIEKISENDFLNFCKIYPLNTISSKIGAAILNEMNRSNNITGSFDELES